MRIKFIFLISIILLTSLFLSAQKIKKIKGGVSKEDENKQKTFVTIGPELSLIMPTDFGARPNTVWGDTMTKFFPNFSFRMGACLRFDFSKTFSFQTGLFYISRSYTTQIGRVNSGQSDIIEEYYNKTLTYTGFEIPLMGLFYVQLGRKWFMDNAVGFSVDFFPSSIVKNASDPTVMYVAYGGRNSWCVPAMKAAIGFEYRSDNAGYFYLGGQFHRPFFAIFDGYNERTNPVPYGLQPSKIPQSGTYFSIDFKYFFPPGKKNKWTEKVK